MVSRILNTLTDADAVTALKLRPSPGDDVAEDAEQDRLARIKLFQEMIVRSAAQRSWTELTLSEIPPHCWCAVVSNNMHEANAALKQMRTDCVVVKAAAAAACESPPHPEVEARHYGLY